MHIKEGITDAYKKQGNDEADDCGDKGTFFSGSDLLKIANAINTRHTYYKHFMVKVVKHIVEAYIIHRQLVVAKDEEAKACEQREDMSRPYTPLGYIPTCNGRPLKAVSSVQCYAKFKDLHAIKHTEAFLSNILINEDGDDDGRMVTWLELYILYRLRGGPKPIMENPRKAISRATADKQIRAFKRNIKAVTERILGHDGDLKLFKSIRQSERRHDSCSDEGRFHI